MLEILIVVTLIAACASAGMIGVVLVRERASTREAREEQGKLLAGFSQVISVQMGSIANLQNAQLESFALRLEQVRTTLQDNAKATRDTLEQRLERLQQDNSAKLEQMRQTVDEKLHATLEQRLSESFRQVSERLEQVHKGLGEMQSLAAGVGDLKKVLSGVKTRGVLGEVQLGALLEQVLTPEQYETNVATRPGSRERVEFAIRMPGQGRDGEPLWLPVDAKFPLEDFQRLQAAQDLADPAAVEEAARALETRVKLEARSIVEKYVEVPYTTEFAVLYMPFEGLYAEVLRRPGLFEQLQREFRVTVCGPTTLSALLNSLQMGFRTLAIQKRSSEVWQVLGGVKAEFGKFGEVLANTKRQLQTVANSIELAETRTRQIERKLKDVEALPEAAGVRLEDAGGGNVVRLPKD
jgi:DNA recombination protein RmuC